MARKLKVYAWTAYHVRGLDKPQFNLSFRCIVAATSKAEVGRVVGRKHTQLWCIGDTGNEKEIAQAMSKPGAVFARIDRFADCEPWVEVTDPVGRF